MANPVSGLTDTFVNDIADGLLQLNITGTAVPEPSMWTAGALSVGVLGFVLRRRVSLSSPALMTQIYQGKLAHRDNVIA